MKVFYHQAAGGNVGDDLNAVLWQRLLPDLSQLTTAQWLIGVGTILDQRLNTLTGRKIVMGSGLRPDASQAVHGDVRFAAVRGKLTAQRLGLGHDVALGDPGFLVGHVWPRNVIAADAAPADRVGLIPHVYSEQWSRISAVAADAGLEVISPTLPPEEFLRRLAGCGRVYCESLHAAIFADALRVPWTRVRICSHYYEGEGVAEFKWRDAFSILDMPVASATSTALIPIRRPWLRPLQAIAERRLVSALLQRRDDASLFRLSQQDRLEERTQTLLSRVMQLRSADEVSTWRSAPRWRLPTTGSPRVLAFPKESENPYVRRFSETLEAAGARVDDFSYRRALTGRYDVLHLHWPDSHLLSGSWWSALAKHARFALLLAYMRLRGTRIVWMMHNLKPHDRNHRLSAWLFPLWFPRACTHLIALTAHGLESGRRMYPALARKPAAVVPHGHYRDEYPPAPTRAASRDRLGLPRDRFTFLFFGNIRRYKNVPLLIRAFRSMPGHDVQLLIAGSPGHAVDAAEIRRLAGDDERIHLKLGFIPDEDVPAFMGAADVVVLPFDSILNSGSVLLALSFNRVVLAPRLGALPEIHSKVGSGWLRLYDGPLTGALLQEARAAQSVAGRIQDAQTADLSAFDWNSIADHTLELYRYGATTVAAESAMDSEGEGGSYETRRSKYSQI